MAQTYTTDPYVGTGKTADAVMEDVNENFAALKSGFAGTSAPASPVGGQTWHDSTARKVRNYANDEWLASLLGDASQKMWVYRNDTCEGWEVDSTLTDRVLAIKGGSYGATGGAPVGSWTQPDCTLTLSHMPAGLAPQIKVGSGSGSSTGVVQSTALFTSIFTSDTSIIGFTGGAPGGAAHNHGTTYRPAAAVGTMQKPDLS